MGVHPNPKPGEKDQLNNRIKGHFKRFPNGGIELLFEAGETLHARSVEERSTEEGRSVRIKFDPNNPAHCEIKAMSESPSIWLDLEKYSDVKIGVNGCITVATCCSLTGCERTECICRKV
ncbi:MAG: hypothetical protein WCO12_01950 [bacterium]